MKTIDIIDLSFGYKKSAVIFENFSISLRSVENKGQITVLMGSSGAGKSTLLKILLGIEKPIKGHISLLPSNPIISYVPQEPVLFEHLSIVDNARYFQFAGAYKARFNETLYSELIEDLGLSSVIKSSNSVMQLSGGQKQRLSLLRALSIDPDFLFLDEPCNGLDAEVKRSFLNKLREIAENHSLSIIYVTHHKLEAQLIADEIVYLFKDKLTDKIIAPSRGTVRQFLHAPPVIEAANVFNFPDVKILSGFKDASGRINISKVPNEITNYWLIKDENIVFVADGGIAFIVISKSDAFAVISHQKSDTEWMLADTFDHDFQKGQLVFIDFIGVLVTYDHNGHLLGEY